MEHDYCGCCGRMQMSGGDSPWCDDCREHVGPSFDGTVYIHLWERTYYAIHGEPCPHQI